MSALSSRAPVDAETDRLEQNEARTAWWKQWGPYLADRQWGTVREDYSEQGESWSSFSHEDAVARTYRWGEDGLLGLCDRDCRLCFSIALHNGADPILKERLFGLTGPEGNHGEDVKELYYFLDGTPTGSYLRALYKYPQREFPYAELRRENARRSKADREYELLDTGVFDDGRYFDVTVEYAKAAPDDILIRITVENRALVAAPVVVLPQLWFRNTWGWGRTGEGYDPKPRLEHTSDGDIRAEHARLGTYHFEVDAVDGSPLPYVFTDNETNQERLYGQVGPRYTKDAFHALIVDGRDDAVRPAPEGTKTAAVFRGEVPAGGRVVLRARLRARREGLAFGAGFEAVFAARRAEAKTFYTRRLDPELTEPERQLARQAYAGLIWTKRFYHYAVREWLEGDPVHPPPPAARWQGRNHGFAHLYNRDVISLPDAWEYPWYAAWDLAFHMIPMARIDPHFAKAQLILFLREWYMHPNGQIPAYEFHFDDVNPPVHAWAVWRVYELTGRDDRAFLARCFHKLLLNFTWWVNRTDEDGNNLFSGGFLGLDNIGLFDRSKPLPGGGHLEQADGTAWMAFYCTTMLAIALELADSDPAYEDVASKFLEHFVAIAEAMNRVGGSGLWDERDGFYYDLIHWPGHTRYARLRSMVGIIPLFAVDLLPQDLLERMKGFHKRMEWFLRHRPDMATSVTYMADDPDPAHRHHLLALPSRERLERVLRYVLDEDEMLSPHGVRALSRHHLEHPLSLVLGGEEHRVGYVSGESDSYMFGGNSNWRGPVWFPVNFLLIEALERYHTFYGDTFRVECPTGSGQMLTLDEVALELSRRLSSLFLPDAEGHRPCHGRDPRYRDDPNFSDLLLFYEYFDGDDGRGCGASHQTGWTALVASCLERVARSRRA